MKIEVSDAEILDKYSILEIKLERIDDDKKLRNIRKEYGSLTPSVDLIFESCDNEEELNNLYLDLLQINKDLWVIEDNIRKYEEKQIFSDAFIQLARSVYLKNDERSRLKKMINILTNSALTEEKSYKKYQSNGDK